MSKARSAVPTKAAILMSSENKENKANIVINI